MKKILFFIFLFFLIFNINSQDNELNQISDELLKLKNNQEIKEWISKNKTLIDSNKIINLSNLAYQIWYQQADLTKALKLIDITIILGKEFDDSLSLGWALFQKGQISLYTGNYDDASKCFYDGANTFNKGNFPIYEANCWYGLGEIEFYSSNYEKAGEFFDKALILYKANDSLLGEANCLYKQSYILSGRQDYEKSKELSKKALDIYLNLKNSLGEANCYILLGSIESLKNNYTIAIEYYNKAIVLYKEGNYESGVAECYNSLGQIQFYLYEFDKANELFDKALETYKKINLVLSVASCYFNKGKIASITEKYEEAYDLYEKALDIYKKTNAKLGAANCYFTLGEISLKIFDYIKADDLYSKALILYIEASSKLGEANCYYSQSKIAINNNNINSGKELCEKAISIFKDIEEVIGLANCYNSLGEISFNAGDFELSNKYFEKALNIYNSIDFQLGTANCFFRLGEINFISKNYSKAMELYEKALKIYKKTNIFYSMGICYYSISKCYDNSNDKTKMELAGINIEEAIKCMENARTNITDTEQKKSFFSNQIRIYKKGIDITYNINSYDKCFFYLESSRARTLLDDISRNVIFQSNEIDQLYFEKLYKIKEKISAINSIIADKRKIGESTLEEEDKLYKFNQDYNSILKEIYEKYPKFKEITQSKIATIKETRELLSKNEILIEYSIGEESYAFVISNNSFNIIKLVDYDYQQAVDIFRKIILEKNNLNYYLDNDSITTSNKDNSLKKIDLKTAYMITSEKLYEKLIAPIIPFLKNSTSIIISPDENLAFLPFEIIKNQEGKYFIENYEISYIQSASILLKMKGRSSKAKIPFLGFGGAIYENKNNKKKLMTNLTENEKKFYALKSNELFTLRGKLTDIYKKRGLTWENLPGTEKEVKEIGKLYYKTKSNDYKNSIIVGGRVTEERIKEMSQMKILSNYKIIHFATHGYVDLDVPELSSIILSLPNDEEQSKEDGFLTMLEILNLDLDVELVNLSACETGLGKIISGEGISGLTQSIILAGAQNVSVSLWSVSDESTKNFMIRIYDKIKNGSSYKQAFNKTKREFINNNEYNDPFYWAPFVLYGM